MTGVLALPGVYRPQSDTRLLIDALHLQTIPRDARVLELCAGTALAAIAAVKQGRHVTAVDISRAAVLSARINSRRHRAGMRVRRGDLFAAVAGRRFDLILANPPYVPTPVGTKRIRGDHAWNAGLNGRDLITRICEQAPIHLRPSGLLLLVQSSLSDSDTTVEHLRSLGLDTRIELTHYGPLGPIGRQRFSVPSETLVVIRARLEPSNALPTME